MQRLVHIMVVLAIAFGWATAALAHGPETHRTVEYREYGEQQPFGRTGKAAEVTRRMTVELSDRFRFTPERLSFRAGETVSFSFKNLGAIKHEWVLGTPEEITEHAAMMLRFPNMEHDEPQMVHVPPGGKRELVWQFNRPGTFTFACLLPGHHEAGMKGTVEVR